MQNKMPESFPVIQTDRLLLRPLSYADENEIFYLRSDEEIHKYLDRPFAKTIEDARAFIDRVTCGFINGNILYWGICIKGEEKIIGTVCLWKISMELRQAETGYELMQKYQGKGYIQEAFAAILKYAFEELELEIIEAELSPENLKSAGLLKRFNFLPFNKLNITIPPDGHSLDTVFYKLEKNQYFNSPD